MPPVSREQSIRATGEANTLGATRRGDLKTSRRPIAKLSGAKHLRNPPAVGLTLPPGTNHETAGRAERNEPHHRTTPPTNPTFRTEPDPIQPPGGPANATVPTPQLHPRRQSQAVPPAPVPAPAAGMPTAAIPAGRTLRTFYCPSSPLARPAPPPATAGCNLPPPRPLWYIVISRPKMPAPVPQGG